MKALIRDDSRGRVGEQSTLPKRAVHIDLKRPINLVNNPATHLSITMGPITFSCSVLALRETTVALAVPVNPSILWNSLPALMSCDVQLRLRLGKSRERILVAGSTFLNWNLGEPDLWALPVESGPDFIGIASGDIPPVSPPDVRPLGIPPTPSGSSPGGAMPDHQEVDHDDNAPFNGPEIQNIRITLKRIAAFVEKSKEMSNDDVETLHERLSYLENALYRQGRIDWVHTGISVMATVIASLGMSPEQATMIWNALDAAVKGFANLLPR